ncbi:UNKNOWN [Stylonychia lemnae]|uniref:Uncharacterized protein n=1 Tax=Stylonychia lemnae TaxID=5949 RepID=A0A078AL07_STYLE|nr:UNKNOWN [Stylonychia lemnae]|eukprot:CDW81528.1 UNKNOWN [Stylonychia lemnae]
MHSPEKNPNKIFELDQSSQPRQLIRRDQSTIININKDLQLSDVAQIKSQSEVQQPNKKDEIKSNQVNLKSNFDRSSLLNFSESFLNHEEIDCNIGEEIEYDEQSGKNINNSFINRLKDFSTFNPSGVKDKFAFNNSAYILNGADKKYFNRDSLPVNPSQLIDSKIQQNYNSARQNMMNYHLKTQSPEHQKKLLDDTLNLNKDKQPLQQQSSYAESNSMPQKQLMNAQNPFSNKKQSCISSPLSSNAKNINLEDAFKLDKNLKEVKQPNQLQQMPNQQLNIVGSSLVPSQNAIKEITNIQQNNSQIMDNHHNHSNTTHSQTQSQTYFSPDGGKEKPKLNDSLNQSMSKSRLYELKRSSSQALIDVESTYVKSQIQKADQGQLIGTDPFFMQLLAQKEEQLQEQKLKLKKMNSKVKQKQHKLNKIKNRLRDTRQDNLDIEWQMNTILASKILQGINPKEQIQPNNY